MDKYFMAFILSRIPGLLPFEVSLLEDFIVFRLRYQTAENKNKRVGFLEFGQVECCFRRVMMKLLHRTWPPCQQATTVLTKITKTNRIPMYAWVADSPESRGCSFVTTMTKKRATKIKTKKTGARSKTTGRGTTFPIPGRTTRDRRGQKKWSMFT
ncbi:hypothetical protein QR685DRAFT_171925 [Neurospora intermedia]|uniref:Uncharacterized protein n=1 Tax=Neurospora intermedia TaxID=5142 RepID=A0ABR3DNE5_NEUIN